MPAEAGIRDDPSLRRLSESAAAQDRDGSGVTWGERTSTRIGNLCSVRTMYWPALPA
jgi:hypothetical protein